MLKVIDIPYQDKEGLRISLITKKDLHKIASDDLSRELDTFLSNNPPRKNESYILINALGAGEVWGSNSRGDYFPESQLKVEHPEYGYKTFEIYGNFYEHHQNKVFANRIGYVKKAIWVDDLKKVMDQHPKKSLSISNLENQLQLLWDVVFLMKYVLYASKKLRHFQNAVNISNII
jgi:hypothetical protein